MALFVGTVSNKVDKKGRVSVPASFRAELSGASNAGIYVFPSYKFPSLEACDHDFMARLSSGLESLALFSEQQDDLAATIFADARLLSFDGEGRIVLPDPFMAHAGIVGQAAFVGQGPRFQIWKPEALDAHKATARNRAREQQMTVPLGPLGGGR